MRLGRRIGTAALPCLMVLTAAVTAGCNGSSNAEDPPASAPPSTATTAPASGDGQSAAPALDPAHAIEEPGPRTGVLQRPDILVTSSKTLSPETIAAIRHLKHVQDVEVISLVQDVIENQALTVAAVDPATYRNYTPLNVASSQVIWKRVADGEMALRPSLEKKLPFDENDFLTLADSPTPVHLGALGGQAQQIDAVVNETWIDTLDMTRDNALLIRTGSTAPITLRKPIERLIGDRDSVQMVDAIARFGLDPDAPQTALVVGGIADAVGVFNYTVLGGGHIAPDPAWEAAHIATATVPILGSVRCNKAIFPQLIAALNEVIDRGLADKIHPGEYAGCYYPRFIAGTTTLSNHSFGLALDLNTLGNQRGTVGEMDRDVVQIFKSWGFTWGGDWGYTDPMHFEMNTLVEPH